MSHVFGPVSSRRLGRSLGVDLVPFKTCNYDCIYCQIGRTTVATNDRKEWVPFDEVIEELSARLDCRPDFIALSGVGEPTLYSRLGELISRIKQMTEIPVAVLTNGGLLWHGDVRRELLEADLAAPSLDAGDEETFRLANRPAAGLTFTTVVDGLISFRREFKGQYWLEVLLLAGLTDTDEQIRKLAAAATRIRPDRIQLNTVTRPPAQSSARPVPAARLAELARRFDPPAEVIADWRPRGKGERPADRLAILEMLRRHPSTADDVATGLEVSLSDALALLDQLVREGLIAESQSSGQHYYTYRRITAARTLSCAGGRRRS